MTIIQIQIHLLVHDIKHGIFCFHWHFIVQYISKRCGMTFTDKIQPLNYYKTQGYPIPIILSLLLGMTFGTLKFTSRRKLNSAYLYTNLHIQIRVAE